MQGARDGRRGQGQDIDVFANFLQPFLVGDAEALLLVHHLQAQVVEHHILG